MALLADKDGFLIGEPVTVDTGRFAKAAAIWKAIREDTLAIRRALTGIKPPKPMASEPQKAAVAVPRRSAPAMATVTQLKPATVVVRSKPVETATRQRSKPVALPERNAKGQFVSKNPAPERPKDSPNSDPRDDDDESKSFMRRLAGRVAEATGSGVAQSVEGTDQIDPTLTAAKEVGGIVGPLLKPVGAAVGTVFSRRAERKRQREAAKENAKEQHKLAVPWYKRMLGRKTPVTGGSSAGGIFGALAGVLPMLGGLLAGAIPLLVAGAGALLAGGLGAWLGTKIGGWINDKFGTQISDAIWNTSEFIKDTWSGITSKWDSLTTAISDGWSSAMGKIEAAADWVRGVKQGVSDRVGQAKGWLADKKDQALSAIGFGSAGNRKALERHLDAAGITNANERAMIMAQADHETGGFRSMEEGFNYSPERLRQISTRARGMTDAQLKAVTASGQKGIAEFLYGGRNGNNQEGDGYRYRGRGYVQLTGRANYAAASKALGIDLVNNPDLAAQPDIAARIATWYNRSRGLTGAARRGDVSAVTRGINGGRIGLAERSSLFQQYSSGSRGTVPAMPAVATSRRAPVPTAAPNIDKYTPPKPPELLTPIGSKERNATKVEVTVPLPITQNVSDRQIAQLATGGMGGNGQ